MSLLKTEKSPVLEVSDLSVSFRGGASGWVNVVRDLSFKVAPGETLAVVGESGSGKSVSAMAAMRLLPEGLSRVSGKILLEGRDVLKMTEAELLKVRGGVLGMIFQEPMTSLNPVYTIGDQLSESLSAHRGLDKSEVKTEVRRLLDLMRIPDVGRRLKQYPHEISGGMRQRVMIAMAVACSPKLLIADEPTTALDVTVQAQILDLLKSLQRELGMGMLFITHDMGVVAEMADRVLVMNRGDMVESNETFELFADPKSPYTRMLLQSIPVLGSMASYPRPKRFGEEKPAAEQSKRQLGTEPLLEVRDLTTRFEVRNGFLGSHVGNVHAVENVSFSLFPAETLALVGESGSGKSTTGRSILRMVAPTSGNVRFSGVDLDKASREELRRTRPRMQMIFQDPFGSLNPRHTVGHAISEAMRIHGICAVSELPERTAALLERVGLDPKSGSRFPHQFSGGQRQRVCIARALSVNPSLIVADEAVSALDVSVKAQIVDLLIDLQESDGIAYLFISHDMAIVERVSHRVAVMYKGEIVEIGPRSNVMSNPSHPYTRQLLEAVPVPDPLRRRKQRDLEPIEELGSSVFPVGATRKRAVMHEVAAGHYVMA